MRRALALAAIGLVLVAAGCRRASETRAPASTAVGDHVAEARKALAAQSWALAAKHLRAAIPKDPGNLFLHYSLAVCATWLDLREEAIREFEWVMAHAPSNSEEAKTARRWLANRQGRPPTQAAAEPTGPDAGDSAIRGVAMWAEPGQFPTPQARLQLFLVGLRYTPTKARWYVLRSDREGRYEFKRIAAGQYKLTDAIAGPPKWRLKVAVKPGENLALDLTPENSTSVRDDFPQDTKLPVSQRVAPDPARR